jgi:hypothetical protein
MFDASGDTPLGDTRGALVWQGPCLTIQSESETIVAVWPSGTRVTRSAVTLPDGVSLQVPSESVFGGAYLDDIGSFGGLDTSGVNEDCLDGPGWLVTGVLDP